MCKARIRALRNNPKIAHTILRFINVVCKVHIYNIVAEPRIQTLSCTCHSRQKIIMEAARSTDLATHGYVCSGPALWIQESF